MTTTQNKEPQIYVAHLPMIVHLKPVMNLSDEELYQFSQDFVIELRSPSDNLADLQDRMQEYIDNGAELGWLLDTHQRRVYIYRPGEAVQEIDNAETISGDPLLSLFQLDLREIW